MLFNIYYYYLIHSIKKNLIKNSKYLYLTDQYYNIDNLED